MGDFYQLDQLIGCHFNQDYYYINDGEDTIAGIISIYKKTTTAKERQKLKEEIVHFIEIYHDNLDMEFDKRYGFDFSPALWETTAHAFLMVVLEIISTEDNTIYEIKDN